MLVNLIRRLDEPRASLDPCTRWVLVNLIRCLGEQGKTIVTATHELEILCDRALLVRANLIPPQLRRSCSLTLEAEAEQQAPSDTTASSL